MYPGGVEPRSYKMMAKNTFTYSLKSEINPLTTKYRLIKYIY